MGNVAYPLLSDFHPKGEMTRAYDLWNEERGISKRAIIIVDKEGIIRYRNVLSQGLPNPADVLTELENLG